MSVNQRQLEFYKRALCLNFESNLVSFDFAFLNRPLPIGILSGRARDLSFLLLYIHESRGILCFHIRIRSECDYEASGPFASKILRSHQGWRQKQDAACEKEHSSVHSDLLCERYGTRYESAYESAAGLVPSLYREQY